MKFLDWFHSNYANVSSEPIKGQWGLLHITVLVLVIAFIVASSILLKSKDRKTKRIVLWSFCVVLSFIRATAAPMMPSAFKTALVCRGYTTRVATVTTLSTGSTTVSARTAACTSAGARCPRNMWLRCSATVSPPAACTKRSSIPTPPRGITISVPRI